jgi:hypothetical protein
VERLLMTFGGNTPVGDDVITPPRQQLLALLPATLPELEEAFNDSQLAKDRIEWALRTRRAKWDPHSATYIPKGRR